MTRRRGRSSAGRQTRRLTPAGDLVGAGLARRLSAAVSDLAIIGFVVTLTTLLEGILPKEPGTCGPPTGPYTCDVLTLWAAGIFGLWIFAILVSLVFVYPGYFEAHRGGTPGKLILGLRVVDAETGSPISPGRALVRFVVRFFSVMPFFLGYISMLWDPDRRTWHDRIAGSRVVRR